MTTTLLIDTFCATNCAYCELENKKVNTVTYDYHQLDSYLNFSKTKNIIIFAGDTFYNRDNVLKAYQYASSIPGIESVSSVSELSKLARDFNIRTTLFNLCNEKLVKHGCEFSIDLTGNKSGDFTEILNKFILENKFPSLRFNTVLTASHIISDDIFETIEQFMKTYSKLLGVYPLKVVFDYGAVNTNNITLNNLEEKIRRIYDVFTTTNQHPIHSGFLPSIGYKPLCRFNTDGSNLIMYDGTLSVCGKVKREYDVKGYSALDITDEVYQQYLEARKQFVEAAKINEYCNTCEAKHICTKCVKYINTDKQFNGTSDFCKYYKSLAIFLKPTE